MTLNWIGLLGVGLSLVAFCVTYAVLRRRTTAVRLAFAGGFALAALPAVLFAVYYLHVLPETEWFYTLRAWRGSEGFVVFLGCAGGALMALLPRSLLVFPLLAVLALGVAPYLKPILGPLPDSVFTETWAGDTCLQSTASTCAPASICTILRSFGIDTSERATTRAAFSSAGGTEAWYLARFVQDHGLVAQFRFADTFTPELGLPALVGVRFGRVGHFIAVLKVDGDDVTYADPLAGRARVSLAQFRKRYSFTGFHLVISKP